MTYLTFLLMIDCFHPSGKLREMAMGKIHWLEEEAQRM